MRDKQFLRFLWLEGRCRACRVQPPNPYEVDAIYRGVFGCDPMHGPPAGKSMKGPDDGAIPGCRWHHEEQTAIGWPAFEVKYGFLREEEAAIWYTAYGIWKEHQR